MSGHRPPLIYPLVPPSIPRSRRTAVVTSSPPPGQPGSRSECRTIPQESPAAPAAIFGRTRGRPATHVRARARAHTHAYTHTHSPGGWLAPRIVRPAGGQIWSGSPREARGGTHEPVYGAGRRRPSATVTPPPFTSLTRSRGFIATTH